VTDEFTTYDDTVQAIRSHAFPPCEVCGAYADDPEAWESCQGPTFPEMAPANRIRVERIGSAEAWPETISDGLSSACTDCGEVPRFDYRVTEEFWRRWVPDGARIGVVCLPCLDRRCDGEGLVEAIEHVDWTGTNHTIRLAPARRIAYSNRRGHITDSDDPLACWCGPYRDTEKPEVVIHRREGAA